jgi:hypothetical protein
MRSLALLTLTWIVLGCAPQPHFIPAQTRFDISPPRQSLPISLYADCPWIAGPDGAMIVDTGAATYVISDIIAAKNHLKQLGKGRKHVDAHGTRGRSLDIVQIDELKLGNVVLSDFAAFVLRDEQLPQIDKRPMVVLGRALLADCRVTLNYPGLTVALEPASKQPIAPGALTLYAGDPPRIPAKVGGRNLMMGLDTGCSRGITLPWSWRTKLPLERPPAETFISRSAFGSRQVWAARLDGDFVLAGHVLHRPIVSFIAENENPVLGGEVLRYFIVTIDQRTPQVLFRRPAGQTKPIEMPSVCDFGLNLSYGPGSTPTIAGVTPATDAAAQGIAAGDTLLAIDGTPAEEFTDWPRLLPRPDSPPVRVIIRHGNNPPREITLHPTVLVP